MVDKSVRTWCPRDSIAAIRAAKFPDNREKARPTRVQVDIENPVDGS